MTAAVQVRGLAIRRGERLLFSGLDLDVSAGEAVALTGRNGAGKTSLLRAIAGLLRPEAGAVAFEGFEREEGLHLIGHQDGLKPGRTAWEELKFQALWTGGSEASARAAAARFDLERLLELEVRRLSAGQRRRVALARLAASPRPLWLLDEPMAPLDAAHRGALGAFMAEHLARGGMIIAAVHDPLPITARVVEVGA
ncbi:MAG TPA: heme ABC exporter ATP-binding protein CcmA [Caulobacteraceae bacterium]